MTSIVVNPMMKPWTNKHWTTTILASLPDFIFRPAPWAYGYAFRTTLSAITALLIAFTIQLESPYWAATTALIVANPVFGQILSKSFYRLIGTTIGGLMAIVLAALFAQQPELFLIALSLWIGLCMAGSTLLRNFTAYGAILAGYTTAIIALAVVPENPLQTFDTAMARVAAIFVGILTSAGVAALLKPGGAAQNLEERIRHILLEIAQLLQRMREPDPIAVIKPRRRQLAGEILALDTLIEFASAESGRIEQGKNGLMEMAAFQLHAITGIGGVGFAYHYCPAAERQNPLLRAALEEAALAGQQLEAFVAGGPPPDFQKADEKLVKMAYQSRAQGDPPVIPIIIHRLRETLEALTHSASGYGDWRSGKPVCVRNPSPFEFDRDYSRAILNGVRCATIVWLAGLFWIFSAWSNGATLVTITAIFACIASTQKNPLAFGVPFMEGLLLAIPVVTFLVYGLLVKVEGFFPLALLISPPIFLAALASASSHRRLAGIGVSFLTLYFTLLALNNPMVFNFGAYLNGLLATFCGALMAIAGSAFFLPLNPTQRARRLIRTMCGEVEKLALSTSLPTRVAWESQMYDRLSESMPDLPSEAEEMSVLDSAFAALQIGVTLIDLRAVTLDPVLTSDCRDWIHRSLDRLRFLGSESTTIQAVMAESAEELLRIANSTDPAAAAGSEQKLVLTRSAASLQGLSLLLADQGQIFLRVPAEVSGGSR